jgi:hypothetical protein
MGLSYRLAMQHRLTESIPWIQFLGALKVLKYRLWYVTPPEQGLGGGLEVGGRWGVGLTGVNFPVPTPPTTRFPPPCTTTGQIHIVTLTRVRCQTNLPYKINEKYRTEHPSTFFELFPSS